MSGILICPHTPGKLFGSTRKLSRGRIKYGKPEKNEELKVCTHQHHMKDN
jgi:hypothetical protein